MSTRLLPTLFGACVIGLFAVSLGDHPENILSAQGAAKVANPITGEGLPNPAPKVTRNWGQLPAGRSWGTTAGIDIDPIDGNIWAYERCGVGAAAGSGGGG